MYIKKTKWHKNETKQKERGHVTPKEEEVWTGGGEWLGGRIGNGAADKGEGEVDGGSGVWGELFRLDTLYNHTWPLSPPPGQRRSHQCTQRYISAACCAEDHSIAPPHSSPGTLAGRPSPWSDTPHSPAASGSDLGPVRLDMPLLQTHKGRQREEI